MMMDAVIVRNVFQIPTGQRIDLDMLKNCLLWVLETPIVIKHDVLS